MRALLAPAERVALVLWAGSLWATGYLAAPILFRELDQVAVAGAVAGELFTAVAWVGLVCGAILLAGQLRHRIRPFAAHWRLWLVVVMLVVTAVGEFALRPAMADLGPQADVAFHTAHRAAEALYLVNSIIALVLVLGGLTPRAESLGARAED